MTFDAQKLYWPPLSKLFETLVRVSSDDQADGNIQGETSAPFAFWGMACNNSLKNYTVIKVYKIILGDTISPCNQLEAQIIYYCQGAVISISSPVCTTFESSMASSPL